MRTTLGISFAAEFLELCSELGMRTRGRQMGPCLACRGTSSNFFLFFRGGELER